MNTNMSIFVVDRYGQQQLLRGIKSNATILDIKNKYGKQVTLEYNNIQLQDDKSLIDYNIFNGCILKMQITLIVKHPDKAPQLLFISPYNNSTVPSL